MSRLESWLSKEMQFTVASESDIRLTFSGLSKHSEKKTAASTHGGRGLALLAPLGGGRRGQ